MAPEAVVDLGKPARPVRVAVVDDHRLALYGLVSVLYQQSASQVELVAVAPTVTAWLSSEWCDVDVVVLDSTIDAEPDVAANIARVRAAGPQVVLFATDQLPAVTRSALNAGALGLVFSHEPAAEVVKAVLAASRGQHRVPGDLTAAVVDSHADLHGRGVSPQSRTGLWFRHGDPRYPFAWEGVGQPAARWHGEGEGPACYLADTPDGAWAEFLRHEEITDVEDLADVRRRIWAVEVDRGDVDTAASPDLSLATLRGGPDTYEACRDTARRLRLSGATVLRTMSAALVSGGAGGQHLRSGMVEGAPRDGEVLVVYGPVERCRVWAVVDVGSPTARTLSLVEPL